MLNRRGFLVALAGSLALDPERLLWVPGKKLISIPAVRYPNLILTPSVFSRLVLEDLAQALWVVKGVNADYAGLEPFVRIGNMLRVRRPARFRA